jgi:hypothetical protein
MLTFSRQISFVNWVCVITVSGACVVSATVGAAQTTVFSRDRFWLVGTSGSVLQEAPAVATQDRNIRRHMNPFGKPCLALAGTSRPLKFAVNTFEHVVEAKNDCSSIIKVQICYYQSDHCVFPIAPSYGKASTILGVAVAMKDFKYQYREEF